MNPTEYKAALKNTTFKGSVVKNLPNVKCGSCGSAVDYDIYVGEDAYHIAFRQSGYKGIQIPLCKKCYKYTALLNDFVYILVRLIRRFI